MLANLKLGGWPDRILQFKYLPYLTIAMVCPKELLGEYKTRMVDSIASVEHDMFAFVSI